MSILFLALKKLYLFLISMKFKTIFLIALILFFNLPHFAFSPPIIDTNLIHKKCSQLLKDENVLRFKEFFESTVFLNDTVAYYNPNGSLHLFKIEFDTTTDITLLRKSPHNGQNFNRHLFIYDEELFSLGGTGLFSSATALIKFNFEKSQWYELKILNSPKGIRSIISSWIYKNKIYICYETSGQNSNFSFGTINLDNSEYEELSKFSAEHSKILSQDQLGFFQGRIISTSEKYMILKSRSSFSKCNYEIFDLKKGEFLEISFLLDVDCISGKSFVYTNDSSLFFRNENGITVSKKIKDCEIVKSKNFTNYYLAKSSPKILTKNTHYIILFITVMSILFFLSIKRKNKRKINGNDILNKIKKYKNQVLTRDELDKILEINHLQPDSLKTKRSYLINEINSSDRIKIERIRDKDDKRFYNYLIK